MSATVIQPKMKAVGYGAALATILMTLVAVFAPATYMMIPPGFEAASGALITGIIVFVSGYMKKD